ncbi:MAG: ribosome maturation factor RimM [Terriglobia bacterium]
MVPEKSRFMVIARVIRPQGRHGEVTAEITTDFPGRFQTLSRVFIACSDVHHGPNAVNALNDAWDAGTPIPVALERAWPHKGRIVLKLGGIASIDHAEKLRGVLIMIPYEDRVGVPAGTYYTRELEGCRVVMGAADARIEVGTVRAIEPTGGVPVLHVHRTGRDELLIPFAQEICREIDPTAKLIVIDPPEDLLELNDQAAGKHGIGSRE